MKKIHLTDVYDVDYGRVIACGKCAKREEAELRDNLKDYELYTPEAIEELVADEIVLTGKAGEEYLCSCFTQHYLYECNGDCEIKCEGCGAVITGYEVGDYNYHEVMSPPWGIRKQSVPVVLIDLGHYLEDETQGPREERVAHALEVLHYTISALSA